MQFQPILSHLIFSPGNYSQISNASLEESKRFYFDSFPWSFLFFPSSCFCKSLSGQARQKLGHDELSQTPHYADRCLRRICLLALIRAGFILSEGGYRVGEPWPVGSYVDFPSLHTFQYWNSLGIDHFYLGWCSTVFCKIQNLKKCLPFPSWYEFQLNWPHPRVRGRIY